MPDHGTLEDLIWQIADLLRGPYQPSQYGRVMLPMIVLRRFDCVLAPTKAKVLAEYEKCKHRLAGDALDLLLNEVAGQIFHNRSDLDFELMAGEPDNVAKHLFSYIGGFSKDVHDIFKSFEFETEINRMSESHILYLVVSQFAKVDLRPEIVSNEQMGLIFENMIRCFGELADKTSGDNSTPRDIVRLMVRLLFIEDDELLATPGTVHRMLDPACGTGGMLTEAQNYLRERHRGTRLFVYGQDLDRRSLAIAASGMLIKRAENAPMDTNVRRGDSLTEDQFSDETFDYFLTNPPFGANWKRQQEQIRQEHDQLGSDGRFGAGLPRVNDSSLLFLQHMWHKREPIKSKERKRGSRLAILLSGSALFVGGAGSGESNIRRWLIENDWLEAVVALPEQMLYSTGIGTYAWIITNRKETRRKGKIQLVDARDVWTSGGNADRKSSLRVKRRHFTAAQIDEIVHLYGRFDISDRSKVFDNADFGFTRVTVERPLRLRFQMTTNDKARFLDACPHLLDDVQTIDEALGREPIRDWNSVWAHIEEVLLENRSRWDATERNLFRDVFTQRDPDAKPVSTGAHAGGYEPDPALRDYENVALKEDPDAYFRSEVRPHVPDAWMDRSQDKIGYEINFNRYFYEYTQPRSLEIIDAELNRAEAEIARLMREVVE